VNLYSLHVNIEHNGDESPKRDRRLHNGFWWTAEGQRELGIPRRRWEDNIKANLQEGGWGMDWISLI